MRRALLLPLAADEDRARGDLSFAPLYQFLAQVARRTRMDERQVILDTLPKARPPDKSQECERGLHGRGDGDHPHLPDAVVHALKVVAGAGWISFRHSIERG